MLTPFSRFSLRSATAVRWLKLLLLLLFFGRLTHTAIAHAATFDEPLHLLHGVFYWQVTPLYSIVQNPPLINAWLGWPVAWLLRPALPMWDTAAVFQDWLPLSQAFIWHTNPHLPLIFVGRLAIIWLALLTAAGLARWSAQQWHSPHAGLFTLALFTFDPNILAHASLATTDLGTAALFALAAWAIGRATAQPTPARILGAGVATGLLASAKFSAVVLAPALAILVILAIWQWPTAAPALRPTPAIWLWFVAALLVAVGLFTAVYRGSWPALHMDWALQQAHQQEGHSAYLLGQRSVRGWWYYFPLLLLVKTPLVALGVATAALLGPLTQQDWRWQVWWPWIIAGGLLAAGMTSNVNIGYRYLLPMIPLVSVAAGWLATARPKLSAVAALGLAIGVGWLHPHYLAYYNPLAGGPAHGWRVAVDSNYDWGQDLSRLAPLWAAVPPEQRYLAYFGSAVWDGYGVQANPLPGWPTARPNPTADAFYPPAPAPGHYALSVTQLLGVYLDEPDRFAYFQGQTAVARAGYSLFLYDVPPTGDPIGLALSGVGVSHLALPDWQASWASNDVRLRWYDGRTSLLIPAGTAETSAWVALGTGHWPSLPALRNLYPPPTLHGGEPAWAYTLHRWPDALAWPPASAVPTAASLPFGQTLALVGHEWVGEREGEREGEGDTLNLLTYWEVVGQTTAELNLFVHVLDGSGQLVAQHDGLDVRSERWQVGDKVAQWHTIPRPAAWGTAPYEVRVGVYRTADFGRLPTAEGTDWVRLPLNQNRE